MSNIKQYLIMCDKNHREKLQEMAQRLEKVGCKIEDIMDKLGIVAVSFEGDKLQEIYQIEGVENISSGDEQFHAM